MPTYDYRCEANGRVVEVSHRMSEKLATWGELCERANLDCGDTPADTPVQRLATGGNVIGSSNLGSGFDPAPACGAGGCGTGMCGLN
ncbi:zinc ribbon domain-containing protein [uncultured Thiohalocapsa sp.]|uniref:zinc ribbon domain-containing protein n=1 Tax=uncultured Thiohalocapsa sp. TaxID=768990 RepID=UPI0025CE0F44|nr:zinc ribbon domain-containing protein [uncultured Thiohalocapsa sp.]